MNPSKTDCCLKGVNCDVASCEYNNAHECHAGSITVKTEVANGKRTADCETYKKRCNC